jgi:ABC-2 type transport system ATP-binding protein
MSTPVAVFSHVDKQYPTGLFGLRKLCALRNVNLQVERGEIYGLLGPNRAGKTTLVKILLSLCRASSGEVSRLGRPMSDRRTLARIGYVHESQAFPRYLTAPSLLEYYAALNHQTGPAVRRRARMLLERCGLADRSREPIAGFSKGMLQRLALAQALMNEPELLVLDEPSEGMDLTARALLHETLREHRRAGGSAILVSHSLADVERLCDRAGVLRAGQVAFAGSMTDLLGVPACNSESDLESALLPLYELATA